MFDVKANPQKTKKCLLLFSCALLLGINNSSINTMSEKAIISTYQSVNGPWQLLEYIFISNVQNKIDQFQKHSFATLGIAGTAFLTNLFLFGKENNQKPNSSNKELSNIEKTDSKKSIQNIMTILSTFTAGKTAYNYTTCIVKRNIQHKTLINVLKKWELYRENFPTTLVDFFDDLAETYKNNGETFFTSSIVSEIFELINHHIEHHFDARYKKSEQKSINTMEALKSCTDIWKSLA